MKRSVRKRVNLISIEIALIVITFVIFLPILLGITMSIQPPESVFAFPPKLFPTGFHWRNYTEAFRKFPFEYFLMNSLIIGLATTLGKIVTGILAGYAFANFRFFGKSFSFAFLFATLFLPAETIMIVPLFAIMKQFGWVNTYWALTIPFMASATNTFLFRQHFRSMPKELEDAAKIDGAGYMTYFFRILIPLSKAIIGGSAIINFVYAWNMYLWPLIVSMEDKMKTVQIGVKMMIDAEASNNWGIIMAGTMIALFPTLLVFFCLQSVFVKSLVRSGVKG